MKESQAIKLLENKQFNIDVCAGIGALAVIAYNGLKFKIHVRKLIKEEQEQKEILEKLFPWLLEK